MNNPYRARPGRPRVDHAAVSSYGVQNQNSWSAVSASGQQSIPSTGGFPPQHQVTNQPKQGSDPWDWGSENVDNGNDSWNWSVDQQAEAQQQQPQSSQQQPQQQQQQPQFVPSYPNNVQSPSNPQQDNYYKNLNGNNRPMPPAASHQLDGSVVRAVPSREPTPHQQSDNYTNYANYGANQQHPMQARSNASKTTANPLAGKEHSQWSPAQQQQSNQLIEHPDRQIPSFNPYFQPTPPSYDATSASPAIPQQQQPVVNNYNWNVEQSHTPQAQNWQNHTDVSAPGYWHDNVNTEPADIRYKNSPDNQWQSSRDSQTPQTIANNPATDQWQKQNTGRETERINQRQPSRAPSVNHTHPPGPTTWTQSKSLNSSQSWQQMSVQAEPSSGHWSHQHSVDSIGNAAEVGSEDDAIPGRISSKEWTQVKPPLAHFASSTASTTSGSIPNLSSSAADPTDERKKSLATSVASSTSLNDSPTEGKAPILHQSTSGNWIAASQSEANTTSDNSENVSAREIHHQQQQQQQHRADIDWSNDADWLNARPIADLTSSVGQLSLGSGKSQQHEITSSSSSGQPVLPEEIVPAVRTTPRNSLDNAQSHYEAPAPELPAHPSYPGNPPCLPEVPQTNYDHWYNRNSPQAQQSQLAGNTWYANDRTRLPPPSQQPPQPQWSSADQTVENYENIQQQSGDFVNLEVVAPIAQERDIYGSRDSINRETLDNDQKPALTSRPETITNLEIPQTIQMSEQQQTPENYEFASNDRNTFLETGELTDSHQEHESTPPCQDDENDEVPNDIPFLREVPGQSSSGDTRRNRDDPTGQEQQIQSNPRVLPIDPRRNDPTGQALIPRSLSAVERRDVPPGQERILTSLPRPENETLERRNDPSGRERSLPPPPPPQPRNDPSGEERAQTSQSVALEASELREIPGSGTASEESPISIDSGTRQIPGGPSTLETGQIADDRGNARVVTGSREVGLPALSTAHQEQPSESRSKREEAVGASVGETPSVLGPPNRRDSYEDGDDEGSGNSREGSRERRREPSPTDRRRYDYDRKGPYYDRDREYDDDYYYDRRRGADYDRAYNSHEDLDRRDSSYREGERRQTSRDDLDRHAREDPERRGRSKDELDECDTRRRGDRRDRVDEPSRRRDREPRDFDPRYSRVDPRDRDYPERRRDERRPRRYDDYDPRDPPSRRDYYEDHYGRSSRPSSRSSYNDRDRDYYMRARDPYYGYNASYNGYDYGANYNANYYSYLENLRRTNPAAYSEWYHKYYANQHQPQVPRTVGLSYQEDRASVHSGRSSCEDRLLANPSFCFHAPNKSLYVSYFGYPGYAESPPRRRRPSCRYEDRTTTSEKRTLGDMSVLEDSRIVSSRLTPTKFSTSHVIGSLSIGSLLHVHACYPADGERAKVDILRLDYHLMHDPIARELRAYPGPLIKQVGVTHKKTIIEYCESKIKRATVNDELVDKASYILLYELMIMLIQQNGNVVGVDIAQLLLRNKEAHPYGVNKASRESVRRESTISQRSGGTGGDSSAHEGSPGQEVSEPPKLRKTVEQMTDEFRNTLLYGLVQEALEYAMTEGLWGHALFLASKLDKRTHASVMTRFANSLPAQDPLQTLYQLHSGRVPASVTCVSDPKWDDWRPHLAMIISNTSANPEINRRSITSLGDTLASRGDIHAAHFCYILAQLDFGPYGMAGVKLVLIGSNHQRAYEEFVTPEAIMLTEIYEYARNLSEPGFTLVDLQTFKFESARKMIDYGLMEKALLYLEQIAVNVANDPSKYKATFIKDLYTLGDRIKYHDPVCKDSSEDAASLVWLNNLTEILDRCQTGEIIQDYGDVCTNDAPENFNAPEQENHEVAQSRPIVRNDAYNEAPNSVMEIPSVDEPRTEWQTHSSLPANLQEQYSSVDQPSHYPPANNDNNHYNQNQQQDYWGHQNYAQQEYQSHDYIAGDWQQQSANQTHYQNEQADADGSQQQPTWNYEPAPTISMGPSSGKQYDPLKELEALEPSREGSKASTDSKKLVEKGADKKNANAGGSWFGGLFSKLTPKPKNQMILPDDNNPTIVWDPVAKKWTNKDESGNDGGSTNLAPPPKATDMGFRPPQTESPIAPQQQQEQQHQQQQQQQQQQQAPQIIATLDQSTPTNSTKLATGSNMFKLPKGRNMRANYIDVMNPGGTKPTVTNATIPTPATSPLVPMAASSPQLFIPAPVNDPAAPMDFLTPVSGPAASSDNPTQGLSRWSSNSSLSREVQSYTMRDPRLLQRTKGPMMYNPTDVKDRSMKNTSRSRYPPR